MEVIMINWHGPFYSKEETYNYSLLKNGIYAFFSTKKYSRSENLILQYIGLTTQTLYDRLCTHHKWDTLNDTRLVWFGIISNKRRIDLELIEHNFIYFCEPELNERKIYYPPEESIIIISDFFKKDGEKYLKKHTYLTQIPELVYWNSKQQALKRAIRLENIDYNA